MFDKFRLKEALVQYEKDFLPKHWENEKYKWEAVKCFQDNWDVNAEDFADMLSRSLSKTYNLLASMNNFPARMITVFAKTAPEEVRAMYIDLFDETKEVYERINAFKMQSSILLEKYGNGAGHHYQNENAITTYLWLRYPDRYYVYKITEIKSVSDELESDYHFKKGAYADNIRNFFKFYDEICDELKQDTELVNLFRSQLTADCYPDPELKTLTFDVGFYISKEYSKKGDSDSSENVWFPSQEEYTPGITVQEWVALLNDKDVFTQSSLEIMRRFKDYGGEATCTQLAVKYGESKNFYNAGSVGLAKRVVEKTGCPVMPRDSDNSRWWPVLYVGRHATKDEDGGYIWRLRSELSDALDQVDLKDIDLYAKSDDGEEKHGYWWLNANPKIWSFSDLQVGEVQDYTLFNENGNKRRVFQNFIDAKAGDLVIGYESSPVKQIVALAKQLTGGLTNPLDNVAFERIVNVPKRGVGETSLDRIRQEAKDHGLSEYNYIKEIHNLDDTSAVGICPQPQPQAENICAYPNPTTGSITFQGAYGSYHYDLSDRPSGVYILNVEGRPVKVVKR